MSACYCDGQLKRAPGYRTEPIHLPFGCGFYFLDTWEPVLLAPYSPCARHGLDGCSRRLDCIYSFISLPPEPTPTAIAPGLASGAPINAQ